MTSIIVASNKKKAGKTSVVSAICALLNSKNIKSSIYNPFNEGNNSNIFEELGLDLVSNENFQSNDLSQKVINGISNEINLNSKDKTNFIKSIYYGYVIEARLLGGSSLVHLSLKVDESNFHIHARIPGLNFFKVDEKVVVETDPTQIFIFEQ